MALYTDIIIDQGSTYTGKIIVTGDNKLPIDLTGFSARSQIRKAYKSLNATSFHCSIDDPLSGEIFISLTPAETGAMKAGRYLFDVEIYNIDESDVIRVSEGQVEVTPRSTHPNNV